MRRAWTAGAALLAFAASFARCTGVPLTAPSNTTITLTANPKFIPANGGVSVLTAVAIKATGAPVPNGTVVFFFTDLGRIDAEGKTKDGIARVNLVSDSRSGTAHVTAESGGVSAPAPSSSPTATPSPAVRLSFGLETAHADSGANSAAETVTIGSANPALVLVEASPVRITTPRSALITANVFDKDGNPVANVPVIFKVAPLLGARLEETLDSGSAPVFTDTNGQAFDTLRTRAVFDPAMQKSVEVSANLPVGDPGKVTVFIN